MTKIQDTLKKANDALANAQKSWRDENLTTRQGKIEERERVLAEREASLNLRAAKLQRSELRKWFGRVATIVAMIAVAALSYGIGASVPVQAGSSLESVPTVPSASPNVPAETSSYTPPTPRTAGSVSECRRMGEAYFREIGAWPLLSSGEDAATVAAERCTRMRAAFDIY